MKDTWSVMANPTHREIQQMLQKRDMTAGGEPSAFLIRGTVG